MKTNFFASLLVIGSILFSAAATFAAMPKAGDTAPLFTGQDQDGKTVKLAESHRQENRAALFLSEGLHRRAAPRKPAVSATAWANCRRTTSKSSASALIPPKATSKFIAEYKLNFPLLADPGRQNRRCLRRAGRRQKTWRAASASSSASTEKSSTSPTRAIPTFISTK